MGDDVLMATDLAAWCKGRLDRCTLLMTPSQPGVLPLPAAGEPESDKPGALSVPAAGEPESDAPGMLPFPAACEPELDELHSLDNAKVLRGRLTSELLVEELSAMHSPC